jgi:hypothetical protein
MCLKFRRQTQLSYGSGGFGLMSTALPTELYDCLSCPMRNLQVSQKHPSISVSLQTEK